VQSHSAVAWTTAHGKRSVEVACKKFSPLVLPVMPSFFEKRKQIKISANNLKIQFFDFSQLLPSGEQIHQQDAHTSEAVCDWMVYTH
jgi:hypothetical protein